MFCIRGRRRRTLSSSTKNSLPRPPASIEDILTLLHGRGDLATAPYHCLCPAHDDSHDSLTVSLTNDGYLLLHCAAGCSTQAILTALQHPHPSTTQLTTWLERAPLTLAPYPDILLSPRQHPTLPTNPNNTDIGNAQRLYALVKDRVFYIPQLGKWYIWAGTHWQEDTNFTIMALAKATILNMQTEMAHIADDQQRKEFHHWVTRSASRRRLEAMISLLRSEPGIAVSLDQLDQHNFHLPCKNGTINLRTGHLEPADPAHKFTKCLDLDYDMHAQCPLWQSFLLRIMDGNAELIPFIQRLVGHALTGDVSGKYFVFMWGPTGNNGKSTLAEIIMRLLGPFAIKSPTQMVMLKSHRTAAANDIARLRSIRLTVTHEVDEDMTLSETIIKDLTGRDTLTARFLRHEFFDFAPTHKLWIYGNHRPAIRTADPALWDRVKLLPFAIEIPEQERDPHLLEKLTHELNGILAWAVAGCLEWQRLGIHAPHLIKAATDDYRLDQDLLGDFIDDCFIIDPASRLASRDLYTVHVAWCREIGLQPLSSTKLGLALERRGFPKIRIPSLRLRQGLELSVRGAELLYKDRGYR